MQTLVRRGRVDDAPDIARVHVAAWRAAYQHAFTSKYLAALSMPERENRWRDALADRQEAVFVAESDGGVVGFIAVGSSRDADASTRHRDGELHTIYVHPDYWGAETGAELHDVGVQALIDDDYQEATLWVLDTNTRARRFYVRCGWTPDGGAKHGEYGGTSILEVRYRRSLKTAGTRPG